MVSLDHVHVRIDWLLGKRLQLRAGAVCWQLLGVVEGLDRPEMVRTLAVTRRGGHADLLDEVDGLPTDLLLFQDLLGLEVRATHA